MASLTISAFLVDMGHELAGECLECRFDSLYRHWFGILTPSGVNSWERTFCLRCKEQEPEDG